MCHSPPWLSQNQDPYVDVYIDGACSYNGSDESKAGIGVWFGPNNPLNVSRPVRGRRTNNAAEIEAATEAAYKAREAGIKKLRINTDSKFLINSATEWIPKWEANEWKNYNNKPVQNRAEFENLKRAIETLDVEWNHIPSHQGVEGNEEADRLARKGIEKELPPLPTKVLEDQIAGESIRSSNPREVIMNIPTPFIDSEEDETEIDTPEIAQNENPKDNNMNQLKEDLRRSFSQFDKSITKRGTDLSEVGTESMMWDHEGMDDDLRPAYTHVSDGEKNEELLEQIRAPDPCEEYDDRAFSERIQKFLREYADRMQKQKEQDQSDSPHSPSEEKEKEPESPNPHKHTNSGVALKNVVRFKDQLRECSSPECRKPPPRRSWYPTPVSLNFPGAMSTPFPANMVDKESDKDPPQKKFNWKPRKFQEDASQDAIASLENASGVTRVNVNIPFIPSESYPESEVLMKDPVCLKICSWNVAGIRALAKKNGFDYLKQENPDIIALQEVKCDQASLPDEAKLERYQHYLLEGTQKVYCGVSLFSKIKPVNVTYGLQDDRFDTEARVITAEYDDFFLTNVYAPFSGDKLLNFPKRLEWNAAFTKFVQKLDETKMVIICGDLNVALNEIDLAEPERNYGVAGFTQQERASMTGLLEKGFVDSLPNNSFHPPG